MPRRVNTHNESKERYGPLAKAIEEYKASHLTAQERIQSLEQAQAIRHQALEQALEKLQKAVICAENTLSDPGLQDMGKRVDEMTPSEYRIFEMLSQCMVALQYIATLKYTSKGG